MKKYQIYGFNYLSRNTNGINVITGTNDESEYEFEIPCFDGLSYFKVNGEYYVAYYKKMNKLNSHDKELISDYCGYEPCAGEYGVILGALGVVIQTDKKTFDNYSKQYPIKEKDKKRLCW